MDERHQSAADASVDSALRRTPYDHRLQFYETDELLFQATAAFLAEGLDAGELLLVIATPAHHIGFLAALTSRGFDPDALCAAGWLTLADAQGCLALFMVGRMPDETLFKACIGGLLDQIPPSGPRGRLRVYGEMVDLLWTDGNPDAALRLEGFWSEIARRQPLSRLSGCGLESYTLARDDEDRAREISVFQQRDRALEAEVEHRKALEQSLRETKKELTRPSAAGGRRILVVDDNVDATESLAMFLAFIGNEVQTAHDGAQAVQKAEEFRPDVVLLDIGLPVMNGHDAGRRIRQQSWAAGTTLIALSGWGQDGDKEKSRAAGFDHHLVKPVDLKVLSTLLAGVEASAQPPGVDDHRPPAEAAGGIQS